MIIAGAGSAGKETLEILLATTSCSKDIFFYDEGKVVPDLVFDKYRVFKDENSLKEHLVQCPDFCAAIGNSRLRKRIYERIIALGGKPINIFANNSFCISKVEVNGTIIQPGVTISYDVSIGKSCIIHANSTIGHKADIGDFVNIGPLTSVIGPITIGDHCFIGAGSVLLPNIIIGKNVIIPAGSVVKRNLMDYETF